MEASSRNEASESITSLLVLTYKQGGGRASQMSLSRSAARPFIPQRHALIPRRSYPNSNNNNNNNNDISSASFISFDSVTPWLIR